MIDLLARQPFTLRLREEVADQIGHVLGALTQRRQINRDHMDPVEQVVTKQPLLHLLGKIFHADDVRARPMRLGRRQHPPLLNRDRPEAGDADRGKPAPLVERRLQRGEERPVATAGGPRKVAFAKEHGADHAIDYRAGDFREEVLKLTGGRGVDRVYDPVGGDVFAQSLRCLAVEGRICPIGFAGGTIPQIPANILLVKSIAVMGFNYGYYVGWSPHDARFEQAGRTFALMERIRGWCEQGFCRPHVDRTYRLDQAAEAMRALLDRQVNGRVAIVM